MASPSNRTPLLLALVVVLGVGGRLVRDRLATRGEADTSQGPLDLQLARAERVAQEGSTRSPRGRRPRPKSGASVPSRAAGRDARRDVALPPEPPIRSEQTPIGAIAPEALASYLASANRSAIGGQGASVARPGGRRRPRGADPPTPRPPIDVESASAAELERLPRIGPTLARRIVEDRAARGPFGSLDGLQRVRGVGPAMARRLQGHVTFGGAGRP